MAELMTLPGRVEKRLSDLVAMDEFQADEVEMCRQDYWRDRDFWHGTLIRAFERAKERIARGGDDDKRKA